MNCSNIFSDVLRQTWSIAGYAINKRPVCPLLWKTDEKCILVRTCLDMKDRSVGSCSKSSAFAPCCLLLSLTPAARPATHNHPNLTSQITPSSTPASIEHSPTLSTPTIMTSAHRTSPAEHIVTTIESARTSDEIPISLNKSKHRKIR